MTDAPLPMKGTHLAIAELAGRPWWEIDGYSSLEQWMRVESRRGGIEYIGVRSPRTEERVFVGALGAGYVSRVAWLDMTKDRQSVRRMLSEIIRSIAG